MFRQNIFTKTNALELTIVFCFWTKTLFSSVVTPFLPNNVAKRFVDVYLFPTLREGEGDVNFHEGVGGEDNLHEGKRL